MKKNASFQLPIYSSVYPKLDFNSEGKTLLRQLQSKYANEPHIIKLYNKRYKPIQTQKRKEISILKPKVKYNSPEKQNKRPISMPSTNSHSRSKPFQSPLSNQMFLTQIIKLSKSIDSSLLNKNSTFAPNDKKLHSNSNSKPKSMPMHNEIQNVKSLKKTYSTPILFNIDPTHSQSQSRSRNQYVNVYPKKDFATILTQLYNKTNMKFVRKTHNSSLNPQYSSIKSRFYDIHRDNNKQQHYTTTSRNNIHIQRRKKRFTGSSLIHFQRSAENLNENMVKTIEQGNRDRDHIQNEYNSIQDNFSDMKKILCDERKKMLFKNESNTLLAQNLRFSIMKEKIALISKLNNKMVYQLRNSLHKKLRLDEGDTGNEGEDDDNYGMNKKRRMKMYKRSRSTHILT